MKNVDIYLTQSRHETLTVEQICQGMSTVAMPWIAHCQGHTDSSDSLHLTTSLLHCMVYFIFNDFLNALVANIFYVTEVEGKGMQLFYFRKPTWFNIVRDHMQDFATQFYPVRQVLVIGGWCVESRALLLARRCWMTRNHA